MQSQAVTDRHIQSQTVESAGSSKQSQADTYRYRQSQKSAGSHRPSADMHRQTQADSHRVGRQSRTVTDRRIQLQTVSRQSEAVTGRHRQIQAVTESAGSQRELQPDRQSQGRM